MYAICTDYRLGSCTLASHRTMSCRVAECPTASGSVRPPPHENCGTSRALCTPMVKLPTVSGSGHFLCTRLAKIGGRLRLCAPPASQKLRDVSGSLHPHGEVADSLRLCAFFVHSIHQNSGTSQARCTPMVKIADSLRL